MEIMCLLIQFIIVVTDTPINGYNIGSYFQSD
jgi:hypothetical protein